MPANIRLGRKGLAVINTLAYYSTEFFYPNPQIYSNLFDFSSIKAAAESGPNVTKLFKTVIYEFS
jgi:hypothetical protein